MKVYLSPVGAGGAADSSGNNTSLWGGGNVLNIVATGGSVATGVTSSFNLKYINLTAAFLYCKYCTSDTDCVSGKKCDLTTGICKPPIEFFTRTDAVRLYGSGGDSTTKKPTDCAQDCLNTADCVGFNISWQGMDPIGGDNPGWCRLFSSVTSTRDNMWFASFVKKT